MPSPAPHSDSSTSQQPDLSFSKDFPGEYKDAHERLLAWAVANQTLFGPRPPPSKNIDRSERRPNDPGGPVRLLLKDGVLTELGKRAERERAERVAAEAAAKAKSDDVGKKEAAVDATEGGASCKVRL
jgi:hypothetical protein